uniref:Uncharacterized protein n=1 Tax=Ananas comosus var. bracteatus TaxID=296719 RepID=A0A6V7PKZ5_ANACO|nr:unnamed protein product [Ananas comosus var. bracteatus]
MSDSRLTTPLEVAEEGRSTVKREWIEKISEVDDTRGREREGLSAQPFGVAYGPTIFKRERKANGLRELPKPRAVAIGPYHPRENSLTFNDDYKWKITRLMVNELGVDVKKYLAKMEEEEEDARSYYSEGLLEWSSKDLHTMLLFDSSFILFVINPFYKRWWPKSQGAIWEYNMTLSSDVTKYMKQIKLDLLMPDNQIPFFAIKKLLECFPEDEIIFKEDPIEHLALCFFGDLWPMRNEEQKMDDETDFDHLLHLFHWSRVPVEGYEIYSEELGSKNASEQYIPSATELRKSAIKFEKKHSGSNLDITFTRGLTKISAVINIPTLHLYDYSEEIFRNLIAFEKNPTSDVRCFMAYSAYMHVLPSAA